MAHIIRSASFADLQNQYAVGMRTLARAGTPGHTRKGPPRGCAHLVCRGRHTIRPRDKRPANGTYPAFVTSPDLQRAKFAEFVDRALRRAQRRGLTIESIERASGVTRSTIYRWRRGDLARFPTAVKVRDLCEALGEDPQEAITILWPSKASPVKRQATPPGPLDPDLVELARILEDPRTSKADVAYIRRFLRQLASTLPEDPPARNDGAA